MTIGYSYFAHVTPSHPALDDPSLVCRQWTDEQGDLHEEQYTAALHWQRGYTVSNVRSGKLAGEIHPITEEAALRFEELQAARVRDNDPGAGQYGYSLVVTSLNPVDSPRALLRSWHSSQGSVGEQAWTVTHGWVTSNYSYELANDHLDGDAVGITEEQVEHYQDLAYRNYLEATRFIDYRYFAIITEGHPLNDPQAVVRQWEENGAFKEEQYAIDLNWEPSDLMRQQDVQAIPIDAYAVDVFKFAQLKRSQND